MKLVKSILLSLVLVLFGSNVLAENYHIICVAGPNQYVENDFLKQKLFLGLFKKLIKVRNKKAPRNSQIKFESFADKSFTKYNTRTLANKFVKKLERNKNKNLILMGIGQGSNVIKKALELFAEENEEEIKGWQQIIGEGLIEKLGIQIDEDDFSIVLDLLENLTLGFENQALSNSYLEIDLEKIDDQLEPLVELADRISSECCTPKTQKIVGRIFSIIGAAGVIAIILLV